VYYIWAPKCEADCSVPLRFSSNSVCTFNITLCHTSQQFTSLSSTILITSTDRYKSWSYLSCSLIQFPITFGRKSLNSLITTIPKFSLQSFLIVTHQVKHTRVFKKILGKHTRVSISKVTFSHGKEKYDDVVCITPNSFPLHFLILQSLLLITPPKYLRSPLPFQNF